MEPIFEKDYYDEDGDYHGPTNHEEAKQLSYNRNWNGHNKHINAIRGIKTMPTKKKKNDKSKPVLVKVGPHFINPDDVSSIRAVKLREDSRTMYVVDFISRPNPEYTCWINKDEIGILLEQFNIVERD